MDRCGKAAGVWGEAAKLRELLFMSGVKRRAIDRGVRGADFRNNRSAPKFVRGTIRNGKLESGEIYNAAIDRLEAEELAFARSDGKGQRPFTDLLSKCSAFRVPWLFTTFTGDAHEDRRTIGYVMVEIDAIKKRITGARPGSVAYRRKLVIGIAKWLEGTLKRRRYVMGERTNVDLMNSQPGDCTELSRFAYEVLRLAGFKPEYLLIYKNQYGKNVYHVCVGVPLDPRRPDDLMHVDLYYDGFTASGLEHRTWQRAPRNTMLAIFEGNRGWHWAKLRDEFLARSRTHYVRNPRTAEEALGAFVGMTSRHLVRAVASAMVMHFERAVGYDPYFPEPHFNKAMTLYKIGRRGAAARRSVREALRLNPNMIEAQNLARKL